MTKQHVLSNGTLPPMPKGLVPLQNQLAGHIFGDKDNADIYGILDAKDGTILKPCTSRKGIREVKFYQLVFDQYTENGDGIYHKELSKEPLLLALRKFIPAFYGTKSFDEHPDVLYLHLEDVSKHFLRPCLADLKIGKVTWDPDASPEKAQRESAKYPWLNEVCFQLLGMRCYDEAGSMQVFDRWYGRTLSPDRLLREGLGRLFGCGPPHRRQAVVHHVISRLEEIEKWFQQQRYLTLYATSLLIAYEGSDRDTDHSKSGSNVPNVDVRLIDFAHVYPAAGADDNYIEGLQSVQAYLKRLLPLLPQPSSHDVHNGDCI